MGLNAIFKELILVGLKGFRIKFGLICLISVLFSSCKDRLPITTGSQDSVLRFEKILFYTYLESQVSVTPFKTRLTYYFDNGYPHRWIEMDSTGTTLIDYIYEYDAQWKETGALYKEPEEINYSKEIITFKNDSTKLTEWPDSTGIVYYTMIDDLNRKGKTYRATFIGDTIDGRDSTFYTKEGFEKRIFFTNNKGKIFNDRTYVYNNINEFGDWVVRKKIMDDTIREIHYRELNYTDDFTSKNGIYYEGLISDAIQDENVISFSKNEEYVFFTRAKDWQHQTGYIAKKKNGLYTVPEIVPGLDTIYNGAISPNGNCILFATRNDNHEDIWLIEKKENTWSDPIQLSADSTILGGYFHWFNEEEIYFYIPENKGDIVKGSIKQDQINIADSLSILNTLEGTEFSPFMDQDKRYLIFTRYKEGDATQQGFFSSKNAGTLEEPCWIYPTKIQDLPYGWNAYILPTKNVILYSDGRNFYSESLDSLQILK